MVDGIYNIVIKTPMGAKKGELELHTEDGVLTGAMTALGKTTSIEPGKTDGKTFTFSGELSTAVGKLAYECSGEVDGDSLTATAKTKKGNLALKGNRK